MVLYTKKVPVCTINKHTCHMARKGNNDVTSQKSTASIYSFIKSYLILFLFIISINSVDSSTILLKLSKAIFFPHCFIKRLESVLIAEAEHLKLKQNVWKICLLPTHVKFQDTLIGEMCCNLQDILFIYVTT